MTTAIDRFAHVEITDDADCETTARRIKLGTQQACVLSRVVEHGSWYLGCPWNPYAVIEPVLRSLERRGLVKSGNQETPLGRRTVYTATEAGRRALDQ